MFKVKNGAKQIVVSDDFRMIQCLKQFLNVHSYTYISRAAPSKTSPSEAAPCDEVLLHDDVYAFAAKYSVGELAKYALDRFRETLEHHWEAVPGETVKSIYDRACRWPGKAMLRQSLVTIAYGRVREKDKAVYSSLLEEVREQEQWVEMGLVGSI
ncbi:hypothetical protein FE257_004109 [Aspergillus nanangensis]|uniref:Uncharacterized protein n=1 Tax=Aspergillus nanangensis TaxID=2582783 RepID=A0AAD4CAY9_ASPNN|nr:hypothetical protein FE257_004109 [Aspergillus nanangensis]